MRLIEWANARNGSRVDLDGYYGAQCVDLVNDYVKQVTRTPPFSGPTAAAMVDWHPSGFRWVANAAANWPIPGSILVWTANAKAGTGPAGHCAVALAADRNRFLSLDQNWPRGAATGPVWHSYSGVVGWWEPIGEVQ